MDTSTGYSVFVFVRFREVPASVHTASAYRMATCPCAMAARRVPSGAENAIGGEGVIALAEALKANTTLTELHLGGGVPPPMPFKMDCTVSSALCCPLFPFVP